MTAITPIFASEKSAARLLDMQPADFRALVTAGLLPRGREIVPGFERWSVDDLKRIIAGEVASGMSDVEW